MFALAGGKVATTPFGTVMVPVVVVTVNPLIFAATPPDENSTASVPPVAKPTLPVAEL